jgi:putative Holliday junction resolvase
LRILALDFGTARTGAAISDPTETVARPCGVVRQAGTAGGLASVARLVADQAAELVVVGVPVSLGGGEHGQARAARAFAAALARQIAIPVDTYDERYTTKLAADRGGCAELDARAAAVLLEDYLRARAAGAA